MKTFVSLITSENFLPGILALHQSLLKVGGTEKLIVLVSSNLSKKIITFLNEIGISTKLISYISNPNMNSSRLKHNYTKLQIFGLTEFDKIVYIDADMLVCNNIDELFSRPNWSAVNAGGLLPELSDWVNLNSGVMVIEPNKNTFQEMIYNINNLPSKNGGDQGFLHSYFPEWPQKQDLHLDHKYNIYVGHLDRYDEMFGYRLPGDDNHKGKTVSILHFWGPNKPWCYGKINIQKNLHNQAYEMWWQCFDNALEKISKKNMYQNPFFQYLRSVSINRNQILSNAVQQN